MLHPFTDRPSVKVEYLWYFHTKFQGATRHARESVVGIELTVHLITFIMPYVNCQ